MRVGLGFDVHPFDESRPLVLGGVQIDAPSGLGGRSDADVLSHAVADALLGAAGLGDLGDHFPPDKVAAGSSSLAILQQVAGMLAGRGLKIVNVDSTVVLQAPRLGAHRAAMAGEIAGALGIAADRVSVKATTTDHLGFTGRNEGAAAIAVALLEG
ncbi:MAG: 2-C-methyl-D-erythritol 2,4-cyclodiphosphate synthase [Actinomycetota bacterium]